MRKSHVLIIFTIFSILLLAACGNSEEKTQNNEEKLTIEHAMGKTEVPANPKRIVVLTNEGTEALLAMGVQPIGAVQSWTGDPWYDHIKGDMEGVEVVGTESEINLEKIASLKPDLIIGNKMRQEDFYNQLNAIAPTVFSETLRGNWQLNFELYAKAINKEEKGKEILSNFSKRIEKIRNQVGDKINYEVSVVRFLAGDVRIYHKDSFSGFILDKIGFKRPESQNVDDFAEMNVTKERIPAMDGDIMFYFTYEQGDGKATQVEEEWINDPLFKQLNVAKNNRVYKVDDTIWNTAGGVIAANLLLDDLEKHFNE